MTIYAIRNIPSLLHSQRQLMNFLCLYLGPDFRQLVNIRPPSTPTTAGRHRSSIRPVARTSDVDFDQIPSPRPSSSQQRTARHGAGTAGPSSLRKSFAPPQDSPSASESDNEPAGDYTTGNYDDQMDQSGFDDYGPQESPDSQRTPRQSNYSVQSNFSRIEEEEDEEDEEEQEEEPEQPPRQASSSPVPPPSRNDRGKKKAPREETPQHLDEEVEDEIAKGLEDVEMGPDSAEESEPEPPVKKAKQKVAPEKKPPPKTQTRSKKENRGMLLPPYLISQGLLPIRT